MASSQTVHTSGTESQMAYEAVVDSQLQRTKSRVKSVELAQRLLLFVIGFLLAVLVLVLVDHWLIEGGMPKWLRLLSWIGLLVGSVVYIWKQLLPLIIYRINPYYAARTIEETQPSLKNSLINYLSFREQHADLPPVIYEAIANQAATGVKNVSVDLVVDRGQIIRYGYALIAVCFCLAMYFVLSPKSTWQSAKRVMIPWSDTTAPSRVSIVEVTPASTTIFRGKVLQFTAKVEGLHDDEPVQLIYTTEDKQELNRTVEMKVVNGVHTVTLPLVNPNEPAAKGQKSGMQQSIEYYIVAGDATSKPYQIMVEAAPFVALEKVVLEYPSYTNLPKETRENDGTINALEGTKVTLFGTANQPLKAAWVEWREQGKAAGKLDLSAKDQQLTGSFVLGWKDPATRQLPEHAGYALRIENQRKQYNPEPLEYPITVVRDEPPVINLLAPTSIEVTVPFDERMTFEVQALDPDFGVVNVQLKGLRGTEPAFTHTLEAFKSPGKSGPVTSKVALSPKDLQLKVGETIDFYAEVTDNKVPQPNVSQTSVRRLKVLPPKQQNPNDALAQNNPQNKPNDPNQQKPDQQNNPEQKPQPNDANQEPMNGDQKQNGQPQQGQPQNGDQKQNGQPQQGQPQNGDQKQNGQPQQGQPQNGDQKQNGQPQQGQPQNGDQKQNGQPQQGQPQNGDQKQNGQPQQGQPQNGDQKQNGQPQQGQPQNGDQKQNGQPQQGQPQNGDQKQNGQPQQGQPQNGDQKQNGQPQQGQPQNGDQKQNGQPQQGQPQNGDQKQNGQPQQGQPQNGDQKQNGQPQQGQPQNGDQKQNGQPQQGQPQNADQKQNGQPQQGQPQNGEQLAQNQPKDGNQQPQAGRPQNNQNKVDPNGANDGNAFDKMKQHLKEKFNKTPDKPNQEQANAQGNQKPEQGNSADNKAGDNKAGDNKPGDNKNPGDSKAGENNKPGGNKAGDNKAGDNKPGDQNANKPGTEQGQQLGTEQSKQPGDQGKQPANRVPRMIILVSNQPTSRVTGPSPTVIKQRNLKSKRTSPATMPRARPKPKRRNKPNANPMQSSDAKPNESKEQSPNTKQGNNSNTQGQEQGDRDGKGKQGGGQNDNKAGKGAAGNNAADDNGGKAANEAGKGETGKEAGQDQLAENKTGEAGKQAGNGSKSKASDKPNGENPADAGQPGNKETGPTENKKPADKQGDNAANKAKQNQPAGKESGKQPNDSKENQKGQQTGKGPAAGNSGNPAQGVTDKPQQGQPNGPPPAADAEPLTGEDVANNDYAKRATDLVLDHLKDQMKNGQVDQELLQKLGWTEAEMRQFVNRWEQLKNAAQQPGSAGQQAAKQLEDRLRSLGLRPDQAAQVGSNKADDQQRGNQQGRRTAPPAEFRDLFKAFQKGASGG